MDCLEHNSFSTHVKTWKIEDQNWPFKILPKHQTLAEECSIWKTRSTFYIHNVALTKKERNCIEEAPRRVRHYFLLIVYGFVPLMKFSCGFLFLIWGFRPPLIKQEQEKDIAFKLTFFKPKSFFIESNIQLKKGICNTAMQHQHLKTPQISKEEQSSMNKKQLSHFKCLPHLCQQVKSLLSGRK